MAGIIQQRRGTAAEATAANPVLANGQIGVETDTGRMKVGNGVDPWNDLPYVDALGESAAGGLAGHLADATDAHDASAISYTPGGTIASTDVQAAVAEVASDAAAALAAHVDDASDAHDASAISLTPIAGLGNPANVQEALAAVPSRITSLATGVQAFGNRTVFLGDSITRGGQGTSEAALDDDRFRSASIPTWASILSKQRILEVSMAGVGGDTVAQMLARFDTEVTPFAPNVVVIMGGTNDTNSLWLTSLTDYAATMAALVTKVRNIGARPVICTIAPHRGDGAVADRKTRIARINHWLRRWTVGQGITLIDLNALWSDRATDDYATDYIRSGDLTHPSEQGYYDAGARIAAVLSPTLPDNKLPLSASNVDPLNKIANGQFLGALTSGVPTLWTGPVQAGVTASQVTNDATISGNWYRMTSAGHASTNTLSQIVSGIVGGRTYAFAGLLKADFGTTGNLLLRLRFNSSSTAGYEWRPVSLLSRDIPDGAFYLECLAPGDATTAFIEIRYAPDSAGTVEVANLTLIDLADVTP